MPDRLVPSKMQLMGVRMDDITPEQILARMTRAIDGGDRLLVVNANAHLLNLARARPWLRELFARADIAFCDGAGAQFACWFLNGVRPARSTPPDWINPLGALIAARNGSVFWLGGTPDTVRTAVTLFEARHGVEAAGFHHGYFDQRRGSADNHAIVTAINATRPSLLVVNMGMPHQERWLYEHWNDIDVRVAITAGALVDHVAGQVRRPPHWVANLGLEWAVRLALEPRRLWRRYLVGLPVFGYHVLAEKLAPRQWQ